MKYKWRVLTLSNYADKDVEFREVKFVDDNGKYIDEASWSDKHW